jgi:hypothetical protein
MCGFPRGGTTLAAEVLKRHPDLSGGFEGGFLLASEPRAFPDFEPFGRMSLKGWKLSRAELESICDVETWAELYERLRVTSAEVRTGTDQTRWLLDKTPRYMPVLGDVMSKAPGVPVLVIVRDPRAVLWSWAKRTKAQSIDAWLGTALEGACARYCEFGRGWRNATGRATAVSIHVVQYEYLCLDPATTAREMFDAVDLEFDVSYLHFRSRWPNVYGESVEENFINEYKKGFTNDTCDRILELTATFPEFRYDP